MEDADGCGDKDTVILNEPVVMTTVIDSLKNVRCAGDCNGVGRVDVSGGSKPYTYQWSSGLTQTDSIDEGLCVGKWYVDITDANGCSQKDSVIITEPTKLLLGTDTTRVNCDYDCNGTVTANVTGGTLPYAYEWSDPALQSTATATGLCLGVYLVKVLDAEGCDLQAMDTVTATPAPPFNANYSATPMVTTIFNATIEFNNLSFGATTYEWTFGDGSLASSVINPVHEFPDVEPGTYDVWLKTTNILGCLDSIMRTIDIRGDFSLFAPTAFSPNNDGINEYFFPKGLGIDEDNFVMYIYDRWGDLIYETDDIKEPWDGHANDGERASQIDTYVWKVITYDDNEVEHEFVGIVTLIQ